MTLDARGAAGAVLTAESKHRVRQRLIDAGGRITPAAVAAAVRAESGGVVADRELLDAIRELDDDLVGTGPLQPLLADPCVTDVLVTSPDAVWVDRGRGLERTTVCFPDGDAIRRLAQRLAVAAGRRLDEAAPFVDARLPDGTRLHAALPPVAADGVYLSLRVHRPAAHDLAALRALSTFDDELDAVLRAVVTARLAFLVVGGTGSGKTTLLAALLGCVDPDERIVCVEDATDRLCIPRTSPLYHDQSGPRCRFRWSEALRERPWDRTKCREDGNGDHGSDRRGRRAYRRWCELARLICVRRTRALNTCRHRKGF